MERKHGCYGNKPCREHGRHGQNYLHYGHGAGLVVPGRQEEPLDPAGFSLGNDRLQPAARDLLGHSSVSSSVRPSFIRAAVPAPAASSSEL